RGYDRVSEGQVGLSIGHLHLALQFEAALNGGADLVEEVLNAGGGLAEQAAAASGCPAARAAVARGERAGAAEPIHGQLAGLDRSLDRSHRAAGGRARSRESLGGA